VVNTDTQAQVQAGHKIPLGFLSSAADFLCQFAGLGVAGEPKGRNDTHEVKCCVNED